MWIVCWADDSHEMPSLIFSEKKMEKKKNPNVPFALAVIGALRVKQRAVGI